MTTDAGGACRYYGNLVGWRATDSGLANRDYRILDAEEISIGGEMQLSDDLQGAVRFYPRHFRWTLGQTMPMGDLGDYQIFEVAGQTVGGIMKATTDVPRPMWRPISAFRASRPLGGKSRVATVRSCMVSGKSRGRDVVLIATDPQGAVFGLVTKHEESVI